ncbi:MAG: hypothetical protein AMXMBFR34_45630 [Myxococcaceae bacterium]
MKRVPVVFAVVGVVWALSSSCGGGGSNDAGTGGGTGGGSGQLDCAGLLSCAAACTTAQCETDCRTRASTTANTQADAIVACDATHNCQADNTCLNTNCGAQITACLGPRDGGTGGGGGSDGFPARFVGTLTDLTDMPGTLGRLESTGQATFVRDDQADPRGQSGMFAFYKLETVTYTATASGNVGTCTQQAMETVTVANPPAFENLVAISIQAGGSGHQYDVSTSLTRPFPNGITFTCPGAGTSTAHFNAELNVSSGTSMQFTTNTSSLVGSASVTAGRTWSWNLQGQ